MAAGDVIRGRNDAAAARIAADDERHAAELGILQLLHGCEERVQIEMGDDHLRTVIRRPGGTSLAYRSSGGPTERRVTWQKRLLSPIYSRPAKRRSARSRRARRASKAVQSALQLKDRVEKGVRSLDGMEKRVAAIEKRLSALEKTPAKKATPKPRTKAAAKPGAKATPESKAS